MHLQLFYGSHVAALRHLPTLRQLPATYLPNYLSMSAQIHEHTVHTVPDRFVATA